jgi:hypothetical protein
MEVRLRLFQSRFIADPTAQPGFRVDQSSDCLGSQLELGSASSIQATHDHPSSSHNLREEDWLLFWLLLFHQSAETDLDAVSGPDDVRVYKTCRPAVSRMLSLFASSITTIFFCHIHALPIPPRSLSFLCISSLFLSFSSVYPFEDQGNAGVCKFIPSSCTRDTPTKSKRVAFLCTFEKQQF